MVKYLDCNAPENALLYRRRGGASNPQQQSFAFSSIDVNTLIGGVFSPLQNRQPDEKATGYEAKDTARDLEAPRVGKVIVVRVAPYPEVLALQLEGVVRKYHGGHHDKHTGQDEENWCAVDEKSLAAVILSLAADEPADDPDEKKENKEKSKRL